MNSSRSELNQVPPAGNPGTKSALGVVLEAIGAAGVTALLSISICPIFFM